MSKFNLVKIIVTLLFQLLRYVEVADSISCIVSSLDKSERLLKVCKEGEFDKFVKLCVEVITLQYQHIPQEKNRYCNFIPLINKWSSAHYGECFLKNEHDVRNIHICVAKKL